MGRSDHSHIDFDRRARAHLRQFAFLQYAQQFYLGLKRQLAHFVEKKCAAVRELDSSGLASQSAGEGSAHIAEEFGLDQIPGNGTAVDSDERAVVPAAVVMDRAGNQLFSGTGLSLDEDRRVALEPRAQPDRARAAALWSCPRCLQSRSAGRVPSAACAPLRAGLALHRAVDNENQGVEIDRLRHIVIGAQLHRFDGGLDGAKCGNDDDGCLESLLRDCAEQLEAGGRHAQIGNYELRLEFLEYGPRFVPSWARDTRYPASSNCIFITRRRLLSSSTTRMRLCFIRSLLSQILRNGHGPGSSTRKMVPRLHWAGRSELPPMLRGDVCSDGEPESGAVFLGCEEGIEDALLCFGSNAASAVATSMQRRPEVGRSCGSDGHHWLCRLHRIENEIEEELLDLLGIAFNLSRWLCVCNSAARPVAGLRLAGRAW